MKMNNRRFSLSLVWHKGHLYGCNFSPSSDVDPTVARFSFHSSDKTTPKLRPTNGPIGCILRSIRRRKATSRTTQISTPNRGLPFAHYRPILCTRKTKRICTSTGIIAFRGSVSVLTSNTTIARLIHGQPNLAI